MNTTLPSETPKNYTELTDYPVMAEPNEYGRVDVISIRPYGHFVIASYSPEDALDLAIRLHTAARAVSRRNR